MRKVFFVLLMVFLLSSLCHAGVSFKLRGGMGYITGGDWNKGIDGWNQYIQNVSKTRTGELEKLSMGMDLDGEIVYSFGNFGIGIGGGYLKVSQDNQFEYSGMAALGNFSYNYTFKNAWTHGLTVIPIVANLHYAIPIGESMNFNLKVGGGYYMGKFDFKNDYNNVSLFSSKGTETYEAKKNTIGFQGGIGIEYKLSKNISMALDLDGRYAQLKELSGTYTNVGQGLFGNYNTSETENKVWLEDYTTGGQTYTLLEISKDPPTNSKQVVFDLTGFAVKLGICIHL